MYLITTDKNDYRSDWLFICSNSVQSRNGRRLVDTSGLRWSTGDYRFLTWSICRNVTRVWSDTGSSKNYYLGEGQRASGGHL